MDPHAPQGIDVSKPSIARVYDYLLGGKDNYYADREHAEKVLAAHPSVRGNALANRGFMGRAVRYLADKAGIDQFLDIGSGLPTADNVHQVAQRANPSARVVYVDSDPSVLSHGRGLLAENPLTAYIEAEGQDTDVILGHPDTRALIDFSRPVGLLMVSVLHYFPGDPAEAVARYAQELASGSHLVIAHVTSDGASPQMLAQMAQIFQGGEYSRPQADIEAMFVGWPLVDPGLVDVQVWHPTVAEEPSELRLIGGVARKP